MKEEPLTYLLDLNSLDDYRATFVVAPQDGTERPILTIPHLQWVGLGRPGRVQVQVTP